MSLVATISATGIVAPTYEQIRDELANQLKTIYGEDIYIEPDSQDGQMLAIFAQAIYDANQRAIATYNQFSPQTAVGVGLSQVVKINGIRRMTPSNSTVSVRIVGVAGTVITNGIVGDGMGLGTSWALPATVTIPTSGDITVTATSVAAGDVRAEVGTLTKILTPTLGWQSVNNETAATAGDAVESDAELRRRQAISTGIPALSVLNSILGNVAALPGVSRAKIYENDTSYLDANGIPGHTIALVVEGGDVTEICETINLTKTPGTGTYGTTHQVVVDPKGVPNDVSFFILQELGVDVTVEIRVLPGYVSPTADKIKAAVAEWLNRLDIGEPSYTSRIFPPADLQGDAAQDATGLDQPTLDAISRTYVITRITQAYHGVSPQGVFDVLVAFNQALVCDPDNVVVAVS